MHTIKRNQYERRFCVHNLPSSPTHTYTQIHLQKLYVCVHAVFVSLLFLSSLSFSSFFFLFIRLHVLIDFNLKLWICNLENITNRDVEKLFAFRKELSVVYFVNLWNAAAVKVCQGQDR